MGEHLRTAGHAREYRILAAAACLLMSALSIGLGGSLAAFNATTVNPSQFSSASLYSPTAPAGPAVTAVASGHSVLLKWTASSPNRGNGYAISGWQNPSLNAACPTTTAGTQPAAFTFISGDSVSAATTTVTDPATSTFAYNAADEGSFSCYLIQNSYNVAGAPPWASLPLWNSVWNPFLIGRAQIGFVASSVAFADSGGSSCASSCTVDQNDVITITFNQAVNIGSLTTSGTVCLVKPSKLIEIGQSSATCPGTATVATIATATLSANKTCTGSVFAWSASNTVLTVTLGSGCGTGTTVTGPSTLTPATTLQSNTGAFGICTAATTATRLCLPTTTTLP